MKNKKVLMILAIIFIIFIAFTAVYTVHNEKDLDNQTEYSDNSCINKGNVCNEELIKEGILIPVKVNDEETYDFYIIDNDKDYMTLISSENIAYSQWSMQGVNIKGPVTPMFNLYDQTEDWYNVETIDNYVYSDFGYRSCLNNTSKEEKEYCNEGGYHKIKITKNGSFIETNIKIDDYYQNYDLGDYHFKARLITIEEITELGNPKWLVDNLVKNQGYWTMSSSTAANTQFMSGAYALVNIEGEAKVESIDVLNDTIALRAVIVVAKK